MILTYKYRLLTAKRHHRRLAALVESQRLLYNAALEERIDCYRKTGRSISLYEQFNSLTVCRADDPEMAALPVKLQRGTLRRLDLAYQAFFRRVKAGQKPGFPRFKGRNWYDTLEWSEFTGITFDGRRLRSKAFGSIRVHMHRPMEGEIKSARISRDGQGWHVCFSCRVETAEAVGAASDRRVGLSLGYGQHLVTISSGEKIPTPRAAKRAAQEIRRRQRHLARCKPDSRRRAKARSRVAAIHRKVRNKRRTCAHQISRQLVDRFDLIAVGDLDIDSMRSAGMHNRLIEDAGMGILLDMISYKAERAGKTMVRVDPKHTSQDCSGCGAHDPKPLSKRLYRCSDCGLKLDRRVNTARNVLRKAVAGLGELNVAGSGERAPGNIGPSPA